jgi:PAS domain-containing protein
MGTSNQPAFSSRSAWSQALKTIAIIGHDEVIQNSLRDLLESTGLSARCFGSAEEFVESDWFGRAPCLIVDANKQKISNVQLQEFASAYDIVQRKCAEDVLQRTQFYLNQGQRLAHMGSWAFNAAGFDYWSPELFRIHGLDPSSRPPTVEKYLDLVHPEDREFMKEGIQRMLADHREFDFTKRIVRPDGNIRYVRVWVFR